MLQAEERASAKKKQFVQGPASQAPPPSPPLKKDTARLFYSLVYRCYKLLLVITLSSSPIFMR